MSPAMTASMTSTGRPSVSQVVRARSMTGVPGRQLERDGLGSGGHAGGDVFADAAEPDAVLFEAGEAAAGAGVLLRDRGVADDVEQVVAVGELVGAAVDQRRAAAHPDGRAGLDPEALGDGLGRGDLGELADELVGGAALLPRPRRRGRPCRWPSGCARSARCRGGGPVGRSRTKVPRPWTVTTRPCCLSRSIALRDRGERAAVLLGELVERRQLLAGRVLAGLDRARGCRRRRGPGAGGRR